ncbi:MAG: saccharopine dehydrogenase C-terminal domain-containing protein [Phycisphaerae bacterium]
MKNVLVIGAGQSSPYLIEWLLSKAETYDWFVTVADRDLELAQSRVGHHARGAAIAMDVNDTSLRSTQIEKSSVVINMMPPALQPVIAWDCVQHRRHMISVSHKDKRLRDLENDAHRAGVLLLTDVGLDPGLDLMSAMSMLHGIRSNDGIVEGYESYGSGVPGPDSNANPLRYCITWNPRNVVMAAEFGAQYRRHGKTKIVPWQGVFQYSWPINVPGIGAMEAYPNRDSLVYEKAFELEDAQTLIRGTLRYPGWCETWLQIVRLGLPTEHIRIPHLRERSYAEIVEMFLPDGIQGIDLEQRVASFLQINPTGQIMKNLRWLGLFSDEPSGAPGETVAEAMVHLLKTKLVLPADEPDLVILHHIFDVHYPSADRRERIIGTFTHYGQPGGTTAMSKTVGLPAALAAKLLLIGELPLTGCAIPSHELVYRPILKELEQEGLAFTEETHVVQEGLTSAS